MAARVIVALDKYLIEKLIDEMPEGATPIPLILPATGSAYRYDYKGWPVRVWKDPAVGKMRYDCAYEAPEDRDATDVVHDPATRGNDPA